MLSLAPMASKLGAVGRVCAANARKSWSHVSTIWSSVNCIVRRAAAFLLAALWSAFLSEWT